MFKYKISLLIFLFLLNNICINAQDINNKKIQMGVILGTNLNINTADSKTVNAQNPGYDFIIGMNLIKNYNQNLGFNAGIEFDFSTMKYVFQDTLYYDYKDNNIFAKGDKNSSTVYDRIILKERTQKPIYLSIPTMFIFKTDYIGYNRYFAKFGMRHNIVLKEKVSDKDNQNITKKAMTISKELAAYSGSIGISTGTEWNYSGSSTIQFEIGYYYGISNLQREDALFGDDDKNKSLFSIDKNGKQIYETFKSTRNQFSFKISFLF
jgi:hypothetical protein